MKKMFLAVLAAGLMSTSAFADWKEGKVRFIQTAGEDIKINLRLADNTLLNYPIRAASADVQKTIIAMALTAQAANRSIKLFEASGVWTSVILAEAP